MKIYGGQEVLGSLTVGSYTTADRDSLSWNNGTVIYNTTLSELQIYQNDEWVPAYNPYGMNFNLFQSLSVDTDSQGPNLYTSKINSATSALPIGKYEVQINFAWNYNAVNQDFVARCFFDGNNLGQNDIVLRREPKDAAGSVLGLASNQQLHYGRSYFVDVTTAGAKSVLFQFGSSSAGIEAACWDLYIKVFRVS